MYQQNGKMLEILSLLCSEWSHLLCWVTNVGLMLVGPGDSVYSPQVTLTELLCFYSASIIENSDNFVAINPSSAEL